VQNPSQYLFWDDYHPTTAAHKVVQKLASFVLKVKTRNVQVKVPQDFLALEAQDFNDKIDLSCNSGKSCSNPSPGHQPVTQESMVSDRFGGKITIVHLTRKWWHRRTHRQPHPTVECPRLNNMTQ
jgi:hypothetical protein